MQAVLAAEAAGAIELLRNLREEIAANGLVREIPALNRDGDVVVHDGKTVPAKFVGNPAVAPYIALLDRMGLNLPELLATPRAIQKAQTEGEVGDALGDVLAGVMRVVPQVRRPVTVDHEGGE